MSASIEQIAGRLRTACEMQAALLRGRFGEAGASRILELSRELNESLSVGKIVPFPSDVRQRHETPHLVEVSAPREGA